MNIKFLRASSINTYRGCEFQFFMEQILELPSKSGKKALLGTIVHHVLELMAKGSKTNRDFGLIVDGAVIIVEACMFQLHISKQQKVSQLEILQ